MISGKNGSTKPAKAKSSGERYTSLTNKPAKKVSQATIDKIKKMGMTKAINSAKSASPEMLEGIKRMYGARRVSAAILEKPIKPSAPGAITGRIKTNSSSAVNGKKVSTTSSKSSTTKKSTNPNRRPGSIADNIANNRGIFGNKKGK